MRFTLPNAVFFKPNEKFLSTLSQDKVSWILEAGAGTGFSLMKIREYGLFIGNSRMSRAVGFDIHDREEPYLNAGVLFHADALECNLYSDWVQLLVCRPDHGGWVSSLLSDIESGGKVCRRFVYVGLEENLHIDFTQSQINNIVQVIPDVGEDGEVMYIWFKEF